MEDEDQETIDDPDGTDAATFKSEVLEDNVGFLLNSPDYEQVDSEVEEEVNQLLKDEIKKLEFKCRCCKFVTNSFEELEKHENGHRARGSFLECEYCDFCTNTREVMIQHVTKHTGERPFKCKKCKFSSRWKRDLIKHQVKHSDEKKFMCTQCDFTTKWYNNIKHHLIKHSTERPFSCHICDMKFKRKTGLDYHIYRHNDYKPKKCNECDFRCKTNFELKLHQHKHSNVRNFPCTFPGCAQRCKTKSDLSKHIKIHSNVRDKICDICDKGFSTFANLSKHKLRHVAERKFQCDLCASKFKTRISLRNHLQTHNDHKPFSCDVCGHRFRNRHNMKSHKLTHSEDRAFKCPICPYAGKFPFHIFAHIGTFHGDKYAYFCEVCRKPFRRYSQLQTHCGRMHKDRNLLAAVPEIKQEGIDDKHKPEEESQIEQTIDLQNTQDRSEINENTEPEKIPELSIDIPNIPEDGKDEVQENVSGSKEDYATKDIELLTPKTEDPNVIIYNVGPFRLPLATKGFDFNFDKTGKKPKQWFMDPQNMTDQNAAEKQRAYIEKQSRGVDKARGATLRKFGWKKPPYKPCVEDKPRYKQERERLKREKEAGRVFVKQDPDLMELINAGRSNIRKIKICKRAGLLMKNWKELKVKLEKIDESNITDTNQKDMRVDMVQPTDDDSKDDAGSPAEVSNVLPESTVKKRGPMKRKIKNSESDLRIKKSIIQKTTTTISTKQTPLDTVPNTEKHITLPESLKSKLPKTKKTKRPVGRPRKHPKKTLVLKAKKVKSALDLIPPLPDLDTITSPDQEMVTGTVKKPEISLEKTEVSTDRGNNSTLSNNGVVATVSTATSTTALLKRNETHDSISSYTLETEENGVTESQEILVTKAVNTSGEYLARDEPTSSSIVEKPLRKDDKVLNKQQTTSQKYCRTILSIPKIPRRTSVLPSLNQVPCQPKKTTGRLNMAIDKLLAKKTPVTKSQKKPLKLWQPFISLEEQLESTSSYDQACEIRRHRKSDAPRKIKKTSHKNEVNSLHSEPSTSKGPTQMSYEDFILELQASNESQSHRQQKRKPGRPKKNSDPNSPQKILENLLCQPFRSKRNLTDLDVLERLKENESTTEIREQGGIPTKLENDIELDFLQNHKITLAPLYEYLTLKDILSTQPKQITDFSFKTTDLVGPEPDKISGSLDISSAQEKDDLLKIQKCLRNEKYRLKKLDPESLAIKHITTMINTGRGHKPGKRTTTDCPILKKVLMRTKEPCAAADDDTIIADVEDLSVKPIKLIIKKNKIVETSPAETHVKRNDSGGIEQNKNEVKKKFYKEKASKRQKNQKFSSKPKSVKSSKVATKTPSVDKGTALPPLSDSPTVVQRIKRKYTKKSTHWEVRGNQRKKSPKLKINIKKKVDTTPSTSKVSRPKAAPLGKKCRPSAEIKEVLQKYINKKRNITLKKNSEKKNKDSKKKPQKDKASKSSSKSTGKLKLKIKTNKSRTPAKTKGSKSKKSIKDNVLKSKAKGKLSKGKISRKPNPGMEIYVDIEEQDIENKEIVSEYVINSLQEKFLNFPQSGDPEMPKAEPVDEHNLYSEIPEVDIDTGTNDASNSKFSHLLFSPDQDSKPVFQSDNSTTIKSEIDDSSVVEGKGLNPSEMNAINAIEARYSGPTDSAGLMIKDEGPGLVDTVSIKKEQDCYEPFGQYEDISEDEPEIKIKEESDLEMPAM